MRLFVLFVAASLALCAQGGLPARPNPQAAPPQPPPTKPEDLCTIEGRVVSLATGAPIRNATILMMRTDASPGPSGPPQNSTTSTNGSGEFAMKELEPGKYRMNVTRTGFVTTTYGAKGPSRPGTILSLDRGQHMTGVNFRLIPHGVVTGQVLDEFSEPAPYVQVQLVRMQYIQGKKQLAPGGSATTNDLGEYRIFGAAPGKYYLRATNNGNFNLAREAQDHSANPVTDEEYAPVYFPGTTDASAAAQIEVTSGATLSGINLSMSKVRAVHVKGRVVNNTSGIMRQVRVYFQVRATTGFFGGMRSQLVGPKGEFDIRGVTSGSYSVTAIINDGNKTYTGRAVVDVANSNVENLSVVINPPVNVPGRVLIEGEAPQDLSAVEVYLRPASDGGPFFGSSSGRVKEDSTFVLENAPADLFHVNLTALPDGFYVKAIRAGDTDVLTTELDLTRSAPPLEIVLSPHAGLVSGTVQNPGTGMPAPGAFVVLVPQEKERQDLQQFYRTITTDQNGSYTLKNVTPGEYKAFAWEDIEPGAYMDSEVLKPAASKAEAVTVHESDRLAVTLQMIPAEAPPQAAAGRTGQ